MTESTHEQAQHEQAVNAYYDIHTRGFYLEGWHPEHIHFGIFDERKDTFCQEHPESSVEDCDIAVNRMADQAVLARVFRRDIIGDIGVERLAPHQLPIRHMLVALSVANVAIVHG